jgi:hypothetical protein
MKWAFGDGLDVLIVGDIVIVYIVIGQYPPQAHN